MLQIRNIHIDRGKHTKSRLKVVKVTDLFSLYHISVIRLGIVDLKNTKMKHGERKVRFKIPLNN